MKREFISTSKSPIKSFDKPKNILPEKEHGFTLIELIVVIIIVGILAAVGMTQYSSIVEKSRLAEAKIRLGTMRQLAYEYYLNNGTLVGIQNSDVGVDNTCSSTSFYQYLVGGGSTVVNMYAVRCTSGGKTPNASRGYSFFLHYGADPEVSEWHCYWNDDGNEPCFGYSRW
ncbi:prepilin-type N-terminal cleavage/methylation domain-containing protein [bacterium]|nr:MAG: prepilin-type N-terminal cleavage/methylation domain-containing protein [bacterium]